MITDHPAFVPTSANQKRNELNRDFRGHHFRVCAMAMAK
jgi:hypothetical protein